MHQTMWTGLLLSAALAQPVVAQKTPAGPAHAYPTKPIRVVVPFTAGSVTDILARLVGPKLLESWGQQVVVDNRPSAGGTVAGGIVAGAPPDGHTLMVTSSAFTASAAFFPKLPYDSVRDFSGVTQLVSNGLVVVVAPTLGVKSVKELIALAQQKPGQLNFASSGMGSSTHFAGELFKSAAKIDVVHIPYRGTPEALTDTISGRTHYYLASVVVAIPMIKEGRLLGLAVTTAQRAPLMPDVPTVSEAGLPGFEYDGWIGMLAPSATPRPDPRPGFARSRPHSRSSRYQGAHHQCGRQAEVEHARRFRQIHPLRNRDTQPGIEVIRHQAGVNGRTDILSSLAPRIPRSMVHSPIPANERRSP